MIKANEQVKVWCRSVRPDGYGEGVVPERPMPIFDYEFPPDGPSDGMLESAHDDFDYRLKQWYDHINSLPALYLIHPDLAKVGFIGEHREQKEVLNIIRGMWEPCKQNVYANNEEKYRRIVLVPVEGKEVGIEMGMDYQPPVTGEAGEMNRLSEVVGQWPGDEPAQEIINSVSDIELATLVSEYRLMQRTLINISGLGYQSSIKELCEAASRPSDAVEFAEWKDKYFQFTFVHRGKGYRLRYYEYVKEIPGVLFGEHYDVKDIYTIFLKSKQQTTKP